MGAGLGWVGGFGFGWVGGLGLGCLAPADKGSSGKENIGSV
uniref:Uncharacterized protein n=1 Tax=Oryza sativa subsp. japonica TaxID=39947 RepID=Q2R3F4_ORYSJ|nr:hypothetical protein LOC_Os11g32119 [Oryza sativa Japonica Group]